MHDIQREADAHAEALELLWSSNLVSVNLDTHSAYPLTDTEEYFVLQLQAKLMRWYHKGAADAYNSVLSKMDKVQHG